jgi:hypothetical protein
MYAVTAARVAELWILNFIFVVYFPVKGKHNEQLAPIVNFRIEEKLSHGF